MGVKQWAAGPSISSRPGIKTDPPGRGASTADSRRVWDGASSASDCGKVLWRPIVRRASAQFRRRGKGGRTLPENTAGEPSQSQIINKEHTPLAGDQVIAKGTVWKPCPKMPPPALSYHQPLPVCNRRAGPPQPLGLGREPVIGCACTAFDYR